MTLEESAMDGSTMVGPRQRSCIYLPSRYIEELDGTSSPGRVSRKAAFFEEAIRSASNEKIQLSASSSGSSVQKIITTATSSYKVGEDDNVIDHSDAAVRTLDFSSGCDEGSADNFDNAAAVLEEIKLMSVADGQNVDKAASTSASTSPSEGSALKENKDPDSGRQDQELPAKQQEKNNPKASMRGGKKNLKQTLPSMRLSGHLTQRPCASKRRSSIPSDVPRKNPSRCVTAVRKPAASQPPPLPDPSEGGERNKQKQKQKQKMVNQGADFKPRPKSEPQIPTSTIKPQVGTRVAAAKQAPKGNRLADERVEQVGNGTRMSRSNAAAASHRSQGFQLRSAERALKRKQFDEKMEERIAAKTLELIQLREKSQVESEAELRKLRQSLAFKAKPMPSFYRESPPARTTIKVPTTRAISPRLGRLKSDHEHHHLRLCQQQQQQQQQQRNHSGGAIDSKNIPSRTIIRKSRSAATSVSSSPSQVSSTNQSSTVESSTGSSSSVGIRISSS